MGMHGVQNVARGCAGCMKPQTRTTSMTTSMRTSMSYTFYDS